MKKSFVNIGLLTISLSISSAAMGLNHFHQKLDNITVLEPTIKSKSINKEQIQGLPAKKQFEFVGWKNVG